MSAVEQRLDGLERLVAEHGALLRRRLAGLERAATDQTNRVESVAARQKVLYEEYEVLRDSLCNSGVLEPASLQRTAPQPGAVQHGTPYQSPPPLALNEINDGSNQGALRSSLRRSPSRGEGSLTGPGGYSRGTTPPHRGPVSVSPPPQSRRPSFAGGPLSNLASANNTSSVRAPGVYVCGGHASGVTLAGVDRFDPSLGRWEMLPSMPTPRHGCAATSVIGILYVFGGANDSGLPLATAERFDPLVGQWEQLPAMPTARHGCACASAAGMLYALGGYDGEGVLGATERFDPAAGSWEVLLPMPTARGRCAAVAAAGLVYAIGGADDAGREVVAFERYDSIANRWEALAPMPTARCGCAATSIGNHIFVVGGRGNGEKLAGLECFDINSGRWEFLTAMPTARDGCAATATAGLIYVFGGRGVGQTLTSVERYDPGSCKWEPLQPMPKARCGCAAAAVAY